MHARLKWNVAAPTNPTCSRTDASSTGAGARNDNALESGVAGSATAGTAIADCVCIRSDARRWSSIGEEFARVRVLPGPTTNSMKVPGALADVVVNEPRVLKTDGPGAQVR